MLELGHRWCENKDFTSARLEYQKAFRGIASSSYPDGSKQLLICEIYLDIAMSFRQQDRGDEAVKYCRLAECSRNFINSSNQAIKQYNHYPVTRIISTHSQLKPDHFETLDSREKILQCYDLAIGSMHCQIGNLFQKNYKYDKALYHYQQALKITSQIIGKEQDDIAKLYDNIANVYCCQDNYSEALSAYQKSLNIRLSIFGNNDMSITQSYDNIGEVYSKQNRYESALSMYKISRMIRLELAGENSVEIAHSNYNMGKIYCIQEKYDEALNMYDESLQIYHSNENYKTDLCNVYVGIGNVYFHQGNLNEALSYYQKSLDIELKLYGGNNLHVANTYSCIGGVYNKLNKYEDADTIYKKSLAIRLSLLGSKSLLVAHSYHWIGIIK